MLTVWQGALFSVALVVPYQRVRCQQLGSLNVCH